MKPSATRKISTAGKIETARNASTRRVRMWEPSMRRRRSNTSFVRLRATRNTKRTSRMMLRLMRRKKMTLFDSELPLENCGRRVSKNAKSRTATAVQRMISPSRRRCSSADVATGPAMAAPCCSEDLNGRMANLIVASLGIRSAPEEVEEKRDHRTDEQAAREREVEREVVATNQDVSGEPSEPGHASHRRYDDSRKRQHDAGNDQQSPKSVHETSGPANRRILESGVLHVQADTARQPPLCETSQ